MNLWKKTMDPNASHTTKVVDQKKSTKQRFDALNGQSIRLCDVVETLEKKVETVDVDIHKLNILLDEGSIICAAMTDVVAILLDLKEEMEAMRTSVANTSACSW
ncbi:Uncharacterized protein Adt_03975 [Abeliophyllum distichum]|uniref:Uncharacterized protein n=1 Tax=Abeliophyllum distichum TaxID=126358 RepID=A0ABD1W004_9LAMI